VTETPAPRRIAILGGGGQLGRDLRAAWPERHPRDEVVSLDHAAISVEEAGSVDGVLGGLRPDLVVNAAAYHKVDLVESTADRAFAVNAVGARNVAKACGRLGAVCLFVSTDFVFSGALGRPYLETDPLDPPNVYGVSKAAGEMLVRLTCPRHLIVRSCGLYGVHGASGKGGNFVETMLRLAASGNPIRVVDDQVLTPTPTAALAVQVAELAATDAYGTYHATCQGQCSWYEFASEIFRQSGLSPDLSPQSTAESGAVARRPSYSVLENAALGRLGMDRLPPWQEGLSAYLVARREYALRGSPR
jgi:dTDP-4-dehydrorhamnose reductase